MLTAAWAGVGAAYARSFASLCEGTVPLLLGLTPDGDHVDVGCGTGALARAAASRGRRVLAVDAEPEMVALTREATVGLGVRVSQAALPTLALASASVDAVTANFVVNHVPDPRAAVAELARVVRPGGRLAVTSWTSAPTAQAVLFRRAFEASGARPVPGQRLPEHLDYDRSADGLADLLAGGGLRVVDGGEHRWDWLVDEQALLTGIRGGVGAAGQTYRAQSEEVRRRFEGELHVLAVGLDADPQGRIVLPSVAAYAVAAS